MNPTFLVLVIIFNLLTPPLLSENSEDHASTSSADTNGKRSRLEVEGKLSEETMQFLSEHFFIPQPLIKEKYEVKLPQAVEKVVQSQEEGDLSKMISELMGTINLKQVETLVKDAQELSKNEIEGKEPGKRDVRFITLMDRLAWAGLIRLDKETDDKKAEKFNEAFKSDYEETKKWNKKVNEQLELAANGVESAKNWVRENVSMKSILSFAEGQKKSGNDRAADRIIGALSFNQGKEKFLDMFGVGPEPQRLFLGQTNASLDKALDAFLKEKKSFGDNIAARKSHPQAPEKSWYVNSDGGLAKGSPQSFTPPRPPSENPPPPNVNADIGQLKSLVSSSGCTGCHSQIEVLGTSLRDASIKITPQIAKPKALNEVLAAFDSLPEMQGVSESVKSKIREWAKLQAGNR